MGTLPSHLRSKNHLKFALMLAAMKKVPLIATLLTAASLLAGVPAAQASEALARANNCLSCHTVNKRLIGPSFKEIALRYQGKGADEALVRKVREGGSGSFGAVPMPANPNLSEADARALVKWILRQ